MSKKLASSLLVSLTALLVATTAVAQGPVFEVSSTPAPAIATGGSEVLGTIVLRAPAACGGNADGRCATTPGVLHVLYVETPADNSVATGITISETIGGVTTIAPMPGTLITGAVTIANIPQGGFLSIAINGGVDLAADDRLLINGVRGRIVSSPASLPGNSIVARLSASAGFTGSFSQSEVTVARSAMGLEFVSAVPGPGPAASVTVTFQEGFGTAFVQYVATARSGPPANPRLAFGATNNTQLHFQVTGLAGRMQWPQTVPSQLAGGGGVVAGGSELQLIAQNFDGSQATYEFATADQAFSDGTLESFAITTTVCGTGTFSVQAQLSPGLSGRPGFNDPLIPSPGTDPVISAPLCDPSPLAIVSGDNQTGIVGRPLPQPLAVQVKDANGNPVPGVTITFAAPSGGAISAAPANTNLQGIAQAIATLGPELGGYVFTASVNSIGVRFTARAVPAQVPPFPLTTVVPHFAAGGGFLTRITIVNLAAQSNPIQVNFLSQSGELVRSEDHTVLANGRIDVATDEADRYGELITQWAVIGSEFPVGAGVLFEAKLSDSTAPLTTVAFPTSEPSQTLTVPFVFVSGAGGQSRSLTASLALANFSSNSNTVNLTLMDAAGVVRAADSLTLPPFGQIAFPLHERPALAGVLRGQQEFVGSVVIRASAPIAAIDVGNNSGQLFSIPQVRPAECFSSPFLLSQTAVIPHIPVGAGWGTRITLTNLCPAQNDLNVEMFDQAGSPVQGFLGPNVAGGPLQTVVFFSPEAARSGPLAVRWARITAQVGLGVQVLLDLNAISGQAPTSSVGAASSLPLSRFVLPVDFVVPAAGQGEALTSGLALANVSRGSDDIVLQLTDSQGRIVAEETSISLPPQGQTGVVVSELPAFRAFLGSQTQFSGSLRVAASQPTAALAVGFDFGSMFALPVFVLSGPSQ